MPKPLPSNYPKHQRWRFIQRAITDDELIKFTNALVDYNNTDLNKTLPEILKFQYPKKDFDFLKNIWLGIWVNIMHQGGLGYTATSRRDNVTRIMVSDLGTYVADSHNIKAYYYYWALKFQYPFTFPKHKHYVDNYIAIQPVVLICQYLSELGKIDIKETYLTKYEIAEFLMKSPNNSKTLINNNLTQIIANRKKNYTYQKELAVKGFKETATHLFSRGRLFFQRFDLIKFQNDKILVNNINDLDKIRTFLSYAKNPYYFNENSQDVRNQFFLEAYCDLDPDPEILFESVSRKIVSKRTNPQSIQTQVIIQTPKQIITPSKIKTKSKPKIKSIKVVNPPQISGTFGTANRLARKFQQQLRRDALIMYDGKCCVCGLDKPEFLITSHIIPVSVDPSIAADRKNCLLLCVLHDCAMEKGYFGLLDDYSIIVNNSKSKGHPILSRQIIAREKQKIFLPDDKKLHPSPKYLQRHRKIHGLREK